MRKRRISIAVNDNKMDAILYPAGGRKDKVMIVISGSEGGMDYAKKMAEFLSDKGIPALAFGLFETPHTEKKLHHIPVERVGRAIQYLKKAGYEKIGIEGLSKGSELAMAAAVKYPQISCVILKAPSHFYSEGLDHKQPSGGCCWCEGGCELAYTPYKTRSYDVPAMILKNMEFNIYEVNAGKEIVPDSLIPVEKIQAPILMFSAKKDTVWPSEESCRYICGRLKENSFGYRYRHVSFEDMSHMMVEYLDLPMKLFIKSERKNPKACMKDRSRMEKEIVRWIGEVWV